MRTSGVGANHFNICFQQQVSKHYTNLESTKKAPQHLPFPFFAVRLFIWFLLFRLWTPCERRSNAKHGSVALHSFGFMFSLGKSENG